MLRLVDVLVVLIQAHFITIVPHAVVLVVYVVYGVFLPNAILQMV
jgi:hypothetical protein